MSAFVSLVFVSLLAASSKADSFSEELRISRVKRNLLVSTFKFSTTTPLSVSSHYGLFPRVFGDIIRLYNVEELHLSLTQGLWRTSQWGEADEHSARPAGAEIYAFFTASNTTTSEADWRNLVQALSGYFCASLTQIEPQLVAQPARAFAPVGLVENGASFQLKYAVLPSENVCTENLTPWKKLLPCKQFSHRRILLNRFQTGLTHLLNPIKLYDSHYHALTLTLTKHCKDGVKSTVCGGADVEWKLVQSSTTVLDSPDFKFGRSKDWSLRELFDRVVRQKCVFAANSKLYVEDEFTEDRKISFTPPATRLVFQSNRGAARSVAIFDLNSIKFGGSLDLRADYGLASDLDVSQRAVYPLNLHTFVEGAGQFEGSLISELTNRRPVFQKVIYSHVLPWIVRLYYHSLKIKCSSLEEDKYDELKNTEFLHFSPAKDRKKPHHIEIGLNLPSKSTCQISIEFQRSFLRWTEYPPDAHKGFFLPAASLSYRAFDANAEVSQEEDNGTGVVSGEIKRLYGEVIVLILPTPDFSMPYNVLCLVCTVVAICFGPVHNLTTKCMVLISEEELKKKSLRAKLGNFLIKLRGSRVLSPLVTVFDKISTILKRKKD